MTEEKDVVTLVDENGQEAEFEIVDILEIDDAEYAILLPIEDGQPTEEGIILKVGLDENDEEMLFEIEADDEWEMVANAWKQLLEDEADDA